MVGVHFLGFGRFFWAGFYLVGAGVLAAALVGEVLGLSGRSAGSVAAATGIIAALCLFAAGGSTVLRTPATAS